MPLAKVPSGTATLSEKSGSNPLTKRAVTCVGASVSTLQTTFAELVLTSISSPAQGTASGDRSPSMKRLRSMAWLAAPPDEPPVIAPAYHLKGETSLRKLLLDAYASMSPRPSSARSAASAPRTVAPMARNVAVFFKGSKILPKRQKYYILNYLT